MIFRSWHIRKIWINDSLVRKQSARKLIASGDSKAVDAVLEMWAGVAYSEDLAECIQGGLRSCGNRAAVVEGLIKLASCDTVVTVNAIRMLGELGARNATPTLVRCMLELGQRQERSARAAAEALSAMNWAPPAVKERVLLLWQLDRHDEIVRLGPNTTDTLFDILRAVDTVKPYPFGDPWLADTQVRSVLKIIVSIRDPRALTALTLIFREKIESRKMHRIGSVAEALAAMGDNTGVESLLELLREPLNRNAVDAARELSLIACKRALPLILTAIRVVGEDDRRRLLGALGNLKDASALEWLVGKYRSEQSNGPEREDAARAILNILGGDDNQHFPEKVLRELEEMLEYQLRAPGFFLGIPEDLAKVLLEVIRRIGSHRRDGPVDA